MVFLDDHPFIITTGLFYFQVFDASFIPGPSPRGKGLHPAPIGGGAQEKETNRPCSSKQNRDLLALIFLAGQM